VWTLSCAGSECQQPRNFSLQKKPTKLEAKKGCQSEEVNLQQ